MVQPYNYMIGSVQDPTQSFTEGLKIADFLRQRQLQQQQMEREQQRLQDFKKAETEFFGVQGIPTMAQTLRYASYLPKDQAELIIKGRDTQSAEVTKSNLSLAGQVLSSLLADNKQQAIDLVRRRVVAAKTSGYEQISQEFDMIAKSLEAAPSSEVAFKNYAPYVSLLGEEGRKMLESVYKAQERPFAQRKIEAETKEAEFKAKQTEAAVKEATIKLQRLDAIQAAELAKAQSIADQERVKAKYADRIAKADLDLKNAQRQREEYQLTSLKADADKGPTPVFNAQAGGFVVPPTKANPKGGFIPLNAIADNQQQQSAVKALKVAGYDPVTGEDRISKLIEKSTGGVAQALGTEALRAFGFTTEGRKAINELETTANSIVLALMDGKLGAGISNTDRDFITSQLGDVGNPKKPAAERLAGWNAAKNRMITSGMLPPPTGSQPSKDSTPSAQPTNRNIVVDF